LNRNYFIKNNYTPLRKLEEFDVEYWERNYKYTNIPLYVQYYVYKFCRKLIKKKNLKSILDIGCRDGRKLMKLIYPLSDDVYGIDNVKYFIDFCRKYYNSNRFFVDDIENPSLNLKKKFDLIICSDVIEHLLNPDKLLLYIKKYCHSNTYIVISTPERDLVRGFNCNSPPKEGHIREWNSNEFIKYLKHHNFNIISHKIVFHTKISFLVKLLSLSRKKSKRKNIDDTKRMMF
jgi:2-polyprenyl-3-methyl-5-hydroxy-6-metoxy-1,4-benzoquinol methylase